MPPFQPKEQKRVDAIWQRREEPREQTGWRDEYPFVEHNHYEKLVFQQSYMQGLPSDLRLSLEIRGQGVSANISVTGNNTTVDTLGEGVQKSSLSST